MDTKIMDDSTIANAGVSLIYSGFWNGDFRGRSTIISKTSEIDDSSVIDSLISTKENMYELFMLPIQYMKKENEKFKWWAGAGLYYEYQKSAQKGYIIMPDLELIGFDKNNFFKSDFSMHLFGPLLDVGIKYNSDMFNISFSGGIVPLFFIGAKESQRMFPLYKTIEHSQKKGGSPYLYYGFDSILFKYACFSVKHSYAKLKYEVIDLDYDEKALVFKPVFPQNTVISQSLMFEISALIPFGNMCFQIGYGYMLNFYTADAGSPVSENKHYLILAGKKTELKKS